MKECIRCGNPLEDGDEFCKRCGATTGVAHTTPTNDNPMNNQPIDNQPMSEQPMQEPVMSQPMGQPQEPVSPVSNDFNDFGKSVVEPQMPTQPAEENVEEPQQETMKPPKKPSSGNNKIFLVIIGMLVVIAIGIGIFAVMAMNAKDDDKDDEKENKTSQKENTTENRIVEEEPENEVDNEVENTIEKPTTNNGDTIVFNGYEVKLPDNVTAFVTKGTDGDIASFADDKGYWLAEVTIADDMYSEFKDNYDDLEELMTEALGVEITKVGKGTYNGLDVIWLAAEEDNFDSVYVVGKIDSSKCFVIEIACASGERERAVTAIANVLGDAKETDEDSTYLGSDDEFDWDDLDDLGDGLKDNTFDIEKIRDALK